MWIELISYLKEQLTNGEERFRLNVLFTMYIEILNDLGENVDKRTEHCTCFKERIISHFDTFESKVREESDSQGFVYLVFESAIASIIKEAYASQN